MVFWEVVSLGKQPWYGLANHEVLSRVKDGDTLQPPSHIHPHMQVRLDLPDL